MVGNIVILMCGIILIILSALVIFLGGAAMGITDGLDAETPKERRNYFILSIIIIVIGIAVNTIGWLAIRESLKFINTEKNKEETTTENTTENTTEVTTIVINGETYVLQK